MTEPVRTRRDRLRGRATSLVLTSLLLGGAGCGGGGDSADGPTAPDAEPRLQEIELAANAAGVSAATNGDGFLVSYLDGAGLGIQVDNEGIVDPEGAFELTNAPDCAPPPEPYSELLFRDPGLPVLTHAGGNYWASWLSAGEIPEQFPFSAARVRGVTSDGSPFQCAENPQLGVGFGYCGPRGLVWEVSPTAFEGGLRGHHDHHDHVAPAARSACAESVDVAAGTLVAVRA